MENTDKHISGLDKVYEELLKEYKDKNINFLEIGVLNGGSMLMFERMLPKAKIYGIDILDRPVCLINSKVITRVLNQNDKEGLDNFAREIGSFDIVIDDGSHFTKETRNSFEVLWKYIKNGGLYIIEDWIIGVVSENSKNRLYAKSTYGMDKLVYEIASRKKELNISAIKIVVEENNQAYAVYKKGGE